MAKGEKDMAAEISGSEGGGAGAAIALAGEPPIRDLIYIVRDTQVMLDSDLARLYQVETSALNRAAKRNEDRFPEDFRFQLTRDEYENLRCQIGISSDDLRKFATGGRRYLPYAYTEQVVAMLSAVLRSDTAVRVSVQIMKSFVEMRHFIAGNAAMFERVRTVELRQLEYQRTTDAWSVRKTPLWGVFSDKARAS